MKLLLYCTKAKPTLYNVLGKFITTKYMGNDFKQDGLTHPELNGKIVAECDFEVEEITIGRSYGFTPNLCIISTKNLQPIELLSKSCYESYDDLFKYLKYDFDNDYGNHKGPYGYAIHIKNLHIFDKSRELSDYLTRNWVEYSSGPVYAIPQKPITRLTKMISVTSLIYDSGDFMIPVSPQEMCRIANKEQTVIPRKKVLKEML